MAKMSIEIVILVKKCSKIRNEVPGVFLSGGVNTTLCVFWGTILVQSAEMHLETLIAAQKIQGNVAG